MKSINSITTVALVLFSGVSTAQATQHVRGLAEYTFVVETNPKEKDVTSLPVSTAKPVDALPSPAGAGTSTTNAKPVTATLSPSATPPTNIVKPVTVTATTVSPTGKPTALKPVSGGPTSGSGSDPSEGVVVQAPDATFASCSNHPVCSELALTGDCCPTSTGIFLECCVTSCSAHPKCAALGLTGECCPTIRSKTLDCCDFDDELRKAGLARNAKAACSSHPACEGLADYCCPTFDGVTLDCCSATG
jgi:hypothetical protein